MSTDVQQGTLWDVGQPPAPAFCLRCGSAFVNCPCDRELAARYAAKHGPRRVPPQRSGDDTPAGAR